MACLMSQAQREEASTARSRLRAEMDAALAAQQQRAEAWQAKLDAKDARLTELDGKLQVWFAVVQAWNSLQPCTVVKQLGRV